MQELESLCCLGIILAFIFIGLAVTCWAMGIVARRADNDAKRSRK